MEPNEGELMDELDLSPDMEPPQMVEVQLPNDKDDPKPYDSEGRDLKGGLYGFTSAALKYPSICRFYGPGTGLLQNTPIAMEVTHNSSTQLFYGVHEHDKVNIGMQTQRCNDVKANTAPTAHCRPEDLVAENLVIAPYSVDGNHYRGVILERIKDTNSASVRYIDFGNRALLSHWEMIPLRDDLLTTMPVLTTCMKLHLDSMSQGARDAVEFAFQTHAHEGAVIHVLPMASGGEGNAVKWVDASGRDIAQMINSDWQMQQRVYAQQQLHLYQSYYNHGQHPNHSSSTFNAPKRVNDSRQDPIEYDDSDNDSDSPTICADDDDESVVGQDCDHG